MPIRANSKRKLRYVAAGSSEFYPMAVSVTPSVPPRDTDSVENRSVGTYNCFASEWHYLDSNTFRPNSERAVLYAAVQGAIRSMALLPQGHEFHVNLNVATRASDLLGVMSQNFELAPPKVMPQDGEAVVFTWDMGDLKRYVTVDEDEVDVMDLNKKMRIKCVHDIEIEGAQPYASLMSVIGLMPTSTTADTDA